MPGTVVVDSDLPCCLRPTSEDGYQTNFARLIVIAPLELQAHLCHGPMTLGPV